ncbi:uncharacterized protein [Oscarella lobularis]|uniref:uncharacterized protein isoform X1 n=1 Tax=Oscarella lobularis TaxID=121494 RepID=UPI0033135B81
MGFEVVSRSDDRIFAVEQRNTRDETDGFVIFRLKVESQSAPNLHKGNPPAASSTQLKKFKFQRFSLDVDVLHGSRCSSQPGIQPVPLNLWSMERLNTNPIDELDSVAFKMKFFGQPGICLVNFTLQSQSTEKASSFVEILGKRVEKETESDESENAAAVVNHHLALLPVLSKLKPEFTEKRAYKIIVKNMQECEYNGDWSKLKYFYKLFQGGLKSSVNKIVVYYEMAIGELYQKNLERAKKLVKKGFLMCQRHVKLAADKCTLIARAFYIMSGIWRHEKKHDKAILSLDYARKNLFNIASGEDLAGLNYNWASVLLEKGNEEDYPEILRLFCKAKDYCQTYDAEINCVPDRALIRIAWLQLDTCHFNSDDGPTLINDPCMHRDKITAAANALQAVDTNTLQLRYMLQYQIARCDLKILDGCFNEEALDIARLAEDGAQRKGYVKEASEARRRIDWLESRADAKKMPHFFDDSMSDIYISHHPEARPWIDEVVVPILKSAGLTIWDGNDENSYLRQLPFGEKLKRAERQSRCVVVVISSKYQKEKKYENEVNYFFYRKNIYPIVINMTSSSDSTFNVPSFLQTLTVLGKDEERFKRRLLQSVNETIRSSSNMCAA